MLNLRFEENNGKIRIVVDKEYMDKVELVFDGLEENQKANNEPKNNSENKKEVKKDNVISFKVMRDILENEECELQEEDTDEEIIGTISDLLNMLETDRNEGCYECYDGCCDCCYKEQFEEEPAKEKVKEEKKTNKEPDSHQIMEEIIDELMDIIMKERIDELKRMVDNHTKNE